MNIQMLYHELYNALHGLMLANENLLVLTPTDQDAREALQLARLAWRQLDTKQREFIKACEQARRQK